MEEGKHNSRVLLPDTFSQKGEKIQKEPFRGTLKTSNSG